MTQFLKPALGRRSLLVSTCTSLLEVPHEILGGIPIVLRIFFPLSLLSFSLRWLFCVGCCGCPSFRLVARNGDCFLSLSLASHERRISGHAGCCDFAANPEIVLQLWPLRDIVL